MNGEPLRICLCAALCGALLWTGCSASGQKTTAAQPAATPVRVTEVTARDVAILSDFAAQTYARNMVDVRGRVEGYIEKWLFRPGSGSAGGQVLYMLDLRPYQAAVRAGQRQPAAERSGPGVRQNQVSLLQAEANLAAAQANLVKAQQDYDRLKPLVKADAARSRIWMPPVAALWRQPGERERAATPTSTRRAYPRDPDRSPCKARWRPTRRAAELPNSICNTAPSARPSAA